MGTYTDYLNLYKPAAAEQGWHDLVNTNFDTLDAAPQNWDLVRYVDYQNGDDANDGRSRSGAFQTIQAAYDDLKTYAETNYSIFGNDFEIGRIELAPDSHDVGAGLLLDGNRPCEIRGFKGGGFYVTHSTNSRIVSTSSSGTYLVKIDPTISTVGRGSRFYDISFQPSSTTNTSLTSCIHAEGIVYLHVERCSFRNAQQTTNDNVTCIYAVSNGDSSWHHIINNYAAHMQFYYAPDSLVAGNGGNMNRSIIHENVIFYGGTRPMIQLAGDFARNSVSFNNLEGNACGIELGPTEGGQADYNTFIHNMGESSTDTQPYYRFLTHANGTSGPNHNIIMGGNCTADTFGTLAEFSAGASGNLVIGDFSTYGRSGYKAKVVDNSTNKNTLIINTALGILPNIITKTSGSAALVNGNSVVLCDASGGAFTCPLPTAVGIPGKMFTIKRVNATNNVTIDPNGSQTIDGASTLPLTTQWQTAQIVSDGANWFTLASNP